MGKVNSKVSRALQDTVAEHLHITDVHFDANGDHHFNVHDYADDVIKVQDGPNKIKEVKSDVPKGKYARIHITNVVDGNGRTYEIKTPILKSKIVESVSREDILAADAVSDLTLSSALMTNLSPAQQKAIGDILNAKPTSKTKPAKDAE